MALMFRSVLQSGGGAELIVTCDPEFAGATISCSDGTTTLNKTCPVSSPYEVTFKIPNSNDWTISATVSGTTYSSDPISVDLDYETDLEFGFNWRRWVDTARFLDSTDYSTLSDLLADEEAVRELCLEHACVDYLCTSAVVNPVLTEVIGSDLFAKWVNNSDYALDKMYANAAIKTAMDTADKYGYGEWVIIDDTTTPPTWGAKGNVPVMTSNTAPYGEAIANTVYSGRSNYYAFDGSDATGWLPTSVSTAVDYGDYCGYHFTNPICVGKAKLKLRTTNTNLPTKKARLVGSNDKSTWTPISETVNISISNETKEIEFVGNSSSYYLYVAVAIDSMWVTSPSQTNCEFLSLQFYGRELSVSVPVMTSNTTPYGEASLDTTAYSGNDAYRAFDGNYTTDVLVNTASTTASIKYKFVNPISVRMFKYYRTTSGAENSTLQISYSDDGTNFTNAGSTHTYAVADFGTEKVFTLDDDYGSHIYWKLTRTEATAKRVVAVELQFYGLDYSEKEFEEGVTKKWLYDHGLELETLTIRADGGASYEKEDNQIVLIGASSQSSSNVSQAKFTTDYTNYLLMRAKVGDRYLISSSPSYLGIRNTADSQWLAQKTASSILSNPNTEFGVDITNVNETAVAVLGMDTIGGTVFSFTEWWLE